MIHTIEGCLIQVDALTILVRINFLFIYMLAKKLFGDDHEICYDTIINHDVYSWLKVSLEVPRDRPDIAVVTLNGKGIGIIKVHREGKKTLGYDWIRYGTQITSVGKRGHHRQLGNAVAALISDFID